MLLRLLVVVAVEEVHVGGAILDDGYIESLMKLFVINGVMEIEV